MYYLINFQVKSVKKTNQNIYDHSHGNNSFVYFERELSLQKLSVMKMVNSVPKKNENGKHNNNPIYT